MHINHVVYQVQRGVNGMPYIVRRQKRQRPTSSRLVGRQVVRCGHGESTKPPGGSCV